MGSSISQNNKENSSKEKEDEDEEEDEDKDPGRKGQYGNSSDQERVLPDEDDEEELEYETDDTDSEEKMQAEESDKKEEEANEKQQNVNMENGKHDDIQNNDLEHEVHPVKKEEVDGNKEDRRNGKGMTDGTKERLSKEIIEGEEYETDEDTAQQEILAGEGEEKRVKGSISEQDTDGSKKSVIKKLKDRMVAARVGIHWENAKKGKHIEQKDEETQVEQVKQLCLSC